MSESLEHMRWIVAVADFGGFSRAANHLGVSQPALSSVVQAAEANYGARLFDRTTRYLGPTALGELIVSRMRMVISEYDAMIKDVAAFREGQRGYLEIACLSSLAIAVIPTAVRKLKESYPAIRLIINEANSGGVVQQVREHRVELGLCSEVQIKNDLLFTPLTIEQLGVIYSPNHFPHIGKLTWRRALTLPRISLNEHTGIPSLLDTSLPKFPDTTPPVVEVTNLGTIRTLAREGIGVGILPSFALQVNEEPDLAVQIIDDPRIERRIGVVSRRGRTLSPSAEVFMTIVSDLLKSPCP